MSCGVPCVFTDRIVVVAAVAVDVVDAAAVDAAVVVVVQYLPGGEFVVQEFDPPDITYATAPNAICTSRASVRGLYGQYQLNDGTGSNGDNGDNGGGGSSSGSSRRRRRRRSSSRRRGSNSPTSSTSIGDSYLVTLKQVKALCTNYQQYINNDIDSPNTPLDKTDNPCVGVVEYPPLTPWDVTSFYFCWEYQCPLMVEGNTLPEAQFGAPIVHVRTDVPLLKMTDNNSYTPQCVGYGRRDTVDMVRLHCVVWLLWLLGCWVVGLWLLGCFTDDVSSFFFLFVFYFSLLSPDVFRALPTRVDVFRDDCGYIGDFLVAVPSDYRRGFGVPNV